MAVYPEPESSSTLRKQGPLAQLILENVPVTTVP